jgi:hypothetical protein
MVNYGTEGRELESLRPRYESPANAGLLLCSAAQSSGRVLPTCYQSGRARATAATETARATTSETPKLSAQTGLTVRDVSAVERMASGYRLPCLRPLDVGELGPADLATANRARGRAPPAPIAPA